MTLQERNAEIQERFTDGVQMTDIARIFGLTPQRIGQIVRPSKERKEIEGKKKVAVIMGQVKSHADCNTSESVVNKTKFGIEVSYYCFSCLEHVYSFAGDR